MYEKSDGTRLAGKTGQARGKKRKFDTTKKFGVKKRRLDVDQEEINSLDQRVQTVNTLNMVRGWGIIRGIFALRYSDSMLTVKKQHTLL